MREQIPPDGGELSGLDLMAAESLLDRAPGGLPAPSAYLGVAEVLDALRGPASDHELAGQAAALADFRAQHGRRPARRTPGVVARVFTVKAAAAAVAAVSVVGVAAATTDTWPGTRARPEMSVSPTASVSATAAGGPAASAGSTATVAERDRIARLGLCEALERGSGDAENTPAAEALAALAGGADKVGAYCRSTRATAPAGAAGSRGPDATGPAGTGLCRAYGGGRGGEQGGRESAAAFAALARAAGGAGKIEEYCSLRSGRPSRSEGEPAPAPPSATEPRHGPAATPSHPGAPETSRGRGGGPGTLPPAASPAPSSRGGPPTA